MTRLILLVFLTLLLILTACSPAVGASASTNSTGVAGTYDCFGLNNGAVAEIESLTLKDDGTGTFGAGSFQWSYDQNTNQIVFQGDANLLDAEYLADGPSLSVNVAAGGSVANAPDGHFTCVRS